MSQKWLMVAVGLMTTVALVEPLLWAKEPTEQKVPAACQSITDKAELARRGCCSWHGGVCGCSGSRAKCCDGALSPSCGCKADDTSPDKKPALEDNAQ